MVRQFRHSHESDAPPPEEESTPTAAAQKSEDALDSVLDEIDGVLQANAETFVRSFVQKGGQ